MANWWDFGITQPHGVNGEQGVDFGTPIDTPVTSLYAGFVESVGYGPWGGLVTALVETPQGTLTEYALHLDQINVKAGDPLTPGTVLGLSGGQLVGGQHPAEQPYSSGPHVEYGFFSGAAFSSAAVDPIPLIDAAKGGQDFTMLGASGADAASSAVLLAAGAPRPNTGTLPVGPPGANPLAGVTGTAAAIGSIPGQVGHGIADAAAVGAHDVGVFLQRQVIAFLVAALVLLVLFKL